MKVERSALQTSLLEAARFLSVGVGAGFLVGLLIGGVGGRLAMLVLRLTSDPALHGLQTDDGFTVGIISAQTIFLLGTTAFAGALGGVFYVAVRGWIPKPARPWASAVFYGALGAAFAIRPDGVDFTLLSPIPLAIVMFIVLPAAYGVALSWAVERSLASSSAPNRGVVLAGLVPLLPLALFGGIGVFIALGALALWAIGHTSPRIMAAWNSAPVVWLGRGVLVVVAVRALAEVVRDTAEIL
jgi:hypothetical protein